MYKNYSQRALHNIRAKRGHDTRIAVSSCKAFDGDKMARMIEALSKPTPKPRKRKRPITIRKF